MPATPAPSVHDLRAQFETVVEGVLSAEAQSVTADTMERRLLGQVVALGCRWFALFRATRAATTAADVQRDPAGGSVRITANGRAPTCPSSGGWPSRAPTSTAKGWAAWRRWMRC
jgi:hypothetical protein